MIWDLKTLDAVRDTKWAHFVDRDVVLDAPANSLTGEMVREAQIQFTELFPTLTFHRSEFEIFTDDELEYNRVKVLVIWNPKTAECYFPEHDKAMCVSFAKQQMPVRSVTVVFPDHDLRRANPALGANPVDNEKKDMVLTGWDDRNKRWWYEERRRTPMEIINKASIRAERVLGSRSGFQKTYAWGTDLVQRSNHMHFDTFDIEYRGNGKKLESKKDSLKHLVNADFGDNNCVIARKVERSTDAAVAAMMAYSAHAMTPDNARKNLGLEPAAYPDDWGVC